MKFINIIAALLFALQAYTTAGEETKTCADLGIVTSADCGKNCAAYGQRYKASAAFFPDKTTVKACDCTYGPNLENSYTVCKLPPQPTPPLPVQRGLTCDKSGINNEDECKKFCLTYNWVGKMVLEGDGVILRCICQDGQGGPTAWECGRASVSYLRSN